MNRREFLLATAATPIAARGADAVPTYLKGYESHYSKNPRGAAIEWFRNARFGLFLHYGLYSLNERHEWDQLRQLTPVAEYAKLKNKFTARNFNADAICELALSARMKYVNITTRHHDSFCLFRTRYTDFTSLNSPAKRDLVGELAAACQKRGLGLCLYYSHGRDWRHPHAPNNDEWGGRARPEYNPPEPSYAYGKEHDLNKYLDFMQGQIAELLTNYGPVAAIWLDGIGVPLTGDKTKFRCQQLYDYIHSKQPQVLVSYKQGLLGTEDFFAPEHKGIQNPSGKPMEICTTMQEKSWGWSRNARSVSTDEVMEMLNRAAEQRANLLLNSGPMPDGSIYPGHAGTLKEVGERLRKSGFPPFPGARS